MARNGAGVYVLPAGNPVVTGTIISSTWANNTLSDIGNALTQSIASDGQTTISANLPMAGFKLTGLGLGVASTDSATFGQIQSVAGSYVATVGGTADVITLTPAIAIASYVAGQRFSFISSGANTTNVTVNVSGLGAKALTKFGSAALVANDILGSGIMLTIEYDGTQFQFINATILGRNNTFTGNNTFNGTSSFVGDATFSGNNNIVAPGIILEYAGSSAPAGFLPCDGAAVSRATYSNLFTAISTTWGAGDGSTTFNVPDKRGRTSIGSGTGTLVASGVDADVDLTNDTFTVASNSTTWITGMPVLFVLASGTITGLTTSTTYYVIRNNSTTIKLAATLADAQNGVVIDLTAKSSPVWSLTYSLTARTLGQKLGEESHAMSSTELLLHTHELHTYGAGGSNPGQPISSNGTIDQGASSAAMVATGGNASMNVMQPSMVCNFIIKT